VAAPGAPQKIAPTPEDDFTGLQYSDEQKAQIDKIHQQTKMQMDAVAKDQQLTADQKDAMLVGYARLEYSQIYRVLTPEQQRQVLQRNRARRAANQAARRTQPPPRRN
jgi:hypothetical protein